MSNEAGHIKQDNGERRHATIMFADISGFTALSEKIDAEQVTELMNECFEMMGSVIEYYNGSIDKFMGDSVMALFGVPVAIENAASRSINCALEIREKIQDFNQKKNLKNPIDIHIGINTGKVVAGYVGSSGKKEFTVMGDVVNIASRLQHMAEDGQILVGEETFKSVYREFEFKPMDPTSIKGKQDKVPIYELISAQVQKKPYGSPGRRIHSELVGRQDVIQKLKLILDQLVKGNGSILNIIGEPGIGKSRLIAESEKLDAIKQVAYLKGSAISIGENLSYYPIIDILRSWAMIKEDDTSDEAIKKLERAILNVYPKEVDEILPFIGTLMGMKLTGKYFDRIRGIEGERLEKLILRSVKALISKASKIRPIVFVVEDLQWCDLTSIQLLESLCRLSLDHAVLFIFVFRPKYEETSERFLKTIKTRYPDIQNEIYLEPLEGKTSEVLIGNLLKARSMPVEVVAAINERTEGNPLFIEEVVRSLIDDGIIKVYNGRFEISKGVDSLIIPSTIQDVLMARLDRLDQNTKSLLKEASVIGRFFFRRILMYICSSPDNIDKELDFLQELQLIKQRMRLKEIEYFFKHVMSQEVTYNSILISHRQNLHLQVAKAIETVFHDRLNEFYGVLALHYGRGNNLEKAEEYLLKAGEEALKAAASSEALNYFQEGLNIYLSKSSENVNREKIATIEYNIALALYNKGRMAEALTYFDKVLKFEGINDPENKLLASLKLITDIINVLLNLYFPSHKSKIPSKKDERIAQLYYYKGFSMFSTGSRKAFPQSMGVIKHLNQFDFSKIKNGVTIYASSSVLFSITGISFKLSRKILDYAKQYLDTNDIRSVIAYNYYQSLLNYVSGNWEEEQSDWNLVEQNLQVGDITDTSGYVFLKGCIKTEQGNFEEAVRCVEKLHEIGETYENDYTRVRKYLLKASLLLKRRDLDELLSTVDEEVSFTLKAGQQPYALGLVGAKAYAQILNNDYEGVVRTLSDAEEIISSRAKILPFFYPNYTISRLQYDCNVFEKVKEKESKREVNKAIKNVKRIARNARKLSSMFVPVKPGVLNQLGEYYWIKGDKEKASHYWNKSIFTAKQIGAKPDLARAYMLAGLKLLDPKCNINGIGTMDAKQCLIEAEALFRELNLNWDIARLQEVNTRANAI